jgi:acetolactate synthase-1/2/3 large subunit
VQLEVSAPVLYATGEEGSVRALAPERYRAGAPQPGEADLSRIAELLAAAARPIVIAGSGVDRADANDALLRLVAWLGCPVLPTMAGRSVVPRDHAHFVYGLGSGGDLARREADAVLVVGSRLGNLDLPYDKYWGDPERQQVVQIDVDPRHVGVSRPISLGVVADVRSALEGLVHRLEARGPRRPALPDLARYREVDRAWWSDQEQVVTRWKGPGIHPAEVMRAVGRVFGRDAIYATDGGNTSLWASWFLPSTRPRSYLSILELGMLGTGIPSAIGARLGNPERDVVCVTGDGAAGFHFMEMQSAAREGLALVTVVCAEGSWTMEEPNERMLYGRTFGTEMGSVRWDRVAEGLGCVGLFVDRHEELEPALAKAKGSGAPAVVCVRTSRDANLAVPADPLRRFVEVYQGPLG